MRGQFESFNAFKCAMIGLGLMAANVPGDNASPGDDGFRASPHKEYVPSVFYVENEEGVEMPKYIVYACKDNSPRYKDHFIEAYFEDINEDIIGSNSRLVNRVYQIKRKFKPKPIEVFSGTERYFVKLTSQIRRRLFRPDTEGNAVEDVGDNGVDDDQDDDAWHQMYTELNAYRKLGVRDSVVKFKVQGTLLFFQAVMFEVGGKQIDDEFIRTWCKNQGQIKTFVEKVRDLLADIHSCGVIHGQLSLDSLIWLKIGRGYRLKLMNFKNAKCLKSELREENKNEDLKVGLNYLRSQIETRSAEVTSAKRSAVNSSGSVRRSTRIRRS